MTSIITPQEGLALLEQLHGRLVNKPEEYEFGNWRTCVCGGIYRAATGRIAQTQMAVVVPRSPRYRAMLELVWPAMEDLRDVEFGDIDEVVVSISNYAALSTRYGSAHANAVTAVERIIEWYKHHWADELTGMDIGAPQRVITVTPTTSPVPERETEREQIPSREPSREPERTPERVPARD